MATRRDPEPTGATSMDVLLGFILRVGVLSSLVLVGAGLTWHWIRSGDARFDYTLAGSTVFQFVLTDLRAFVAGDLRPRLLLNLGIAVLLLTPYLRVLASMAYFALVERNRTYTLFTGFVLTILSYSLFLR
jgi:uncharacterized membrane protein